MPVRKSVETQITHREEGEEEDNGQQNNQSRFLATLDGDDSTVMTFVDDASHHYVSARFDHMQGIQNAIKDANERQHLVMAPSPGLANSRTGRGLKQVNKTK